MEKPPASSKQPKFLHETRFDELKWAVTETKESDGL